MGDGLVCSLLALLWYLLNPLLCEQTRLCLWAFCGKVLFLSFFLFFSLAIPQFGLLSHVSSLRLSSWHSGPVTLSMQPTPPSLTPHSLLVNSCIWAISLLGVMVRHVICGFFVCYFSFQLCCPQRFQNSPQICRWEGFLVCKNFSSFTTPSPRWVSVPNAFASLLYFVLSPFKENDLPFWVPCVLQQHSEVVLWNLLSVQMIFWWLCGEESGLPVLFLHHLRTALLNRLLIDIHTGHWPQGFSF